MTSKDIAKLAGVSQATVSRALNGNPSVPEEKRKMIQAIADQCGYELNTSARALRTKKTNMIGIVLSGGFIDFNRHYFTSNLYAQVRKTLFDMGYDSYPIYGAGLSDNMLIQKPLQQKQVDGLIFIASASMPDSLALEMLDKHSTPSIVIFYEDNPTPSINGIVTYNSQNSSYVMGKHLIECGHEKIAFCGTKYQNTGTNKLIGLKKAMNEHDLEFDEDLYFLSDTSFELGYKCAMENFDKMMKATAIFSNNDASALGVISALRDKGVSIPDDISVVGIDNLPFDTWWHPYLTTVDCNMSSIALNACSMLIRAMEGEKHMPTCFVESKVVQRESLKKIN